MQGPKEYFLSVGAYIRVYSPSFLILKVPKCEIFDHSDFHDFYAIKSLRVSDFGVKIKICLKNI